MQRARLIRAVCSQLSPHALGGGTSFSVIGAPIGADTAVVSARLDFDVSVENTIELSYDGQIGAASQTHVLKGTRASSF